MKTISTILFILFFTAGVAGLLFNPGSIQKTKIMNSERYNRGNRKILPVLSSENEKEIDISIDNRYLSFLNSGTGLRINCSMPGLSYLKYRNTTDSAKNPGSLRIVSSCLEATNFEIEITKRAFELALFHYKEMGFIFPKFIFPKVCFSTPANWKEDVSENTIALYNDVDQYILIPPFNSRFFQERTILGTKGNKEIYFSILFHEFCHYLNNQVNPRIVRHHDEFIACALQLAVLPEDLRSRIVEEFCGLVFKNRNEISLLAYIYTPKQFQVASYLFMNNHESQMKRIIMKSHLAIRDPFLFPYEL